MADVEMPYESDIFDYTDLPDYRNELAKKRAGDRYDRVKLNKEMCNSFPRISKELLKYDALGEGNDRKYNDLCNSQKGALQITDREIIRLHARESMRISKRTWI